MVVHWTKMVSLVMKVIAKVVNIVVKMTWEVTKVK